MTSRVLVSTRLPAPPQRVFDAFTRDIGAWWVDSPLFRFTPRSPGVLVFEPPGPDGAPARLVEHLSSGKVFVIGEASVWEPPDRIVLDWRMATFGPGHATEVEVRFDAVGAETRITVEHRGWDSVPQEHVARHGFPLPVTLQRQGDHWRSLMAELSACITRSSPAEAPRDD